MSEICRISRLSDPSLFNPTFISMVLLDGLETTGKGPIKRGVRPLVLCCRVYTWVTVSGSASTFGFSLLIEGGTANLLFLS